MTSRKICLVGSAPSSIRLAPYADPSWMIWGCSPGAYPCVATERPIPQQGDAWFELHRWEPPVIGRPDHQVPWFSPEYVQWLKQFPGVVWTGEVIPDLPTSRKLPQRELLDKYGPYFFTSSLAWMLAMAIEHEAQEIALCGVDMSASEEYFYQRPGCQFFIQKALEVGITVTVPPESDLLQPMPLYGVGEWDPMMVKYTARDKELMGRLAGAQQRLEAAKQEVIFLQGAVDNNKYWMNTWIGTANVRDIFSAPAEVVPLQAAD